MIAWAHAYREDGLMHSHCEYERGMYDTEVVRLDDIDEFIQRLRDDRESVIAWAKEKKWCPGD